MLIVLAGTLQYDTKWFHIQPCRKSMRLRVQAKRHSTEDRLDAIFHALSDGTRRLLLKRLAQGPATVGELSKPIDMTRTAVAKHLRVLEKARLMSRTIDGRVHRCALGPQPLHEAERWMRNYRAFWTERLDALACYAEEHDKDQH
jgi:DNA-binding transcriptional ArsR family regulator